MSHSRDKCLTFFRALRQVDKFAWTPECKQASENLKAHLRWLPHLASPNLGKTLGLYLATSKQAIGLVLVREDLEAQQVVYYVSLVLAGPEERYSSIEKLALALIKTA